MPLTIERMVDLEADVVSITHDTDHVYAACRDNVVRVWSKKDWSLVATLGETSSPPLAVHVDADNVYATCGKRVYVWSRASWGMVGWFELSYQALVSTMYHDTFLVGSREGRIVSINKETHETSSWQLYKSELTGLWVDDTIICTSDKKKGNVVVWQRRNGAAPSRMKELNSKERCTALAGNKEFVIAGLGNGDIELWQREDWTLARVLPHVVSQPVAALWANDYYLVAASAQELVTIWVVQTGQMIGRLDTGGERIESVDVDHDQIYVGTGGSLLVCQVLYGVAGHDLETSINVDFAQGPLKTSPYDVLESVLVQKKRGDELVQKGQFAEAVAQYELALQMLIDNTHALLEVPNEREKLTRELNRKLGRALIRSKITELQELQKRVEQVSDEFEMRGRTELEDSELEALWDEAKRAVKESRVLAEARAGDILSYHLAFIADTLEEDLRAAMEKAEKYKEKINQAEALVKHILSEWRWMERRRTKLDARRQFLESVVERLKGELEKTSAEDKEVREILTSALKEYEHLRDQITRIVSAADEEEERELQSRDEAIAAISGLLRLVPRKRDQIASLKDPTERQREYEALVQALNQALETAKQFKLKEEIRNLRNELEALRGLNGSADSSVSEMASTAEGTDS